MRFARTNNEIIGCILLHYAPHRFDVFRRISPIAPSIQVAEMKHIFTAGKNSGDATGDFASDEGFSAPWAFMIEEDAVCRVETVSFPINSRHPVGINFCSRVRASWLERCGFALRWRSRTKHLRTGRLIKARLSATAADRFKQPHRSESRNVAGVLGN